MDYIIVQVSGKGTRLGYLTKNKPKALTSVENLPMLFHMFWIVIPKSANKERMRQNMAVFDFALSEEDMDTIGGLERGRRLGAHPDHFDF